MEFPWQPIIVHGVCIGVGHVKETRFGSVSYVCANTLMTPDGKGLRAEKRAARQSLRMAKFICKCVNEVKGAQHK